MKRSLFRNLSYFRRSRRRRVCWRVVGWPCVSVSIDLACAALCPGGLPELDWAGARIRPLWFADDRPTGRRHHAQCLERSSNAVCGTHAPTQGTAQITPNRAVIYGQRTRVSARTTSHITTDAKAQPVTRVNPDRYCFVEARAAHSDPSG